MGANSDVDYWTLVTILGPLILLGIIAWAIVRNKSSKVSEERTERATHELYQEEQRAHENDKSSGL